GDDLHERTLARPIGTDQPSQASPHLKTDIVQPHDNAVPAAQLCRDDDPGVTHSGFTLQATRSPAITSITTSPPSAPAKSGCRTTAIVSGWTPRSNWPNSGILFCASSKSSLSRKMLELICSRLKVVLACCNQCRTGLSNISRGPRPMVLNTRPTSHSASQ